MLGLVHQLGHVAEAATQAVGHLAPAGMRLLLALLCKCRLYHRADEGLVGLAHAGEEVALEVDAAALPTGPEHLPRSALQPLVRIADDHLHAAQTPAREGARKVRPEGFRFRRHDREAQYLPATIGVDRDRHCHCHRHDPVVLPELHAGRVEPQKRPVSLDGAV